LLAPITPALADEALQHYQALYPARVAEEDCESLALAEVPDLSVFLGLRPVVSNALEKLRQQGYD